MSTSLPVLQSALFGPSYFISNFAQALDRFACIVINFALIWSFKLQLIPSNASSWEALSHDYFSLAFILFRLARHGLGLTLDRNNIKNCEIISHTIAVHILIPIINVRGPIAAAILRNMSVFLYVAGIVSWFYKLALSFYYRIPYRGNMSFSDISTEDHALGFTIWSLIFLELLGIAAGEHYTGLTEYFYGTTFFILAFNWYLSSKPLVNLLKFRRRLKPITYDEANSNENLCSICLEYYVAAEPLIQLPCKHIYHGHCIEQSCLFAPRCPLCRKEF
mgnify:CR=1 FL=1